MSANKIRNPRAMKHVDTESEDKHPIFSWRTTHRKRMAMSARKQIGSDDVVDMELHCVACGTRLYVSVLQANAVIASLERTGASTE